MSVFELQSSKPTRGNYSDIAVSRDVACLLGVARGYCAMFVVMTYGVCFDVTRSESAQRKRE